jgi:CheY-like chemotaxis protein
MEEDISLRVLVVDDVQDHADSLGLLIQKWGHDVRVAYDSDAALAIGCDCQPDIMVVDLAMPGIDGISLCKAIRRQSDFPQPMMVAYTGYGGPRNLRLCMDADFDGFFVKKMDLNALQGLLESFEKPVAFA